MTTSFLKLTNTKKPTTKKEIKKPEGPIMGVYCIRNIKDNKYYIGSSTNIDTRLKTHKQHLLKGCHNCRVLQKDFDKLGIDSFKFDIIEIVHNEDFLTAYEKYYIYKYNSIVKYKGYNEIFPTSNHKLFKEVYNKKTKGNKNEKQENYLMSIINRDSDSINSVC